MNDRMDKVSATEMLDLSLISIQVKPKTLKVGIHRFPASRPALMRIV